jgi:hypothetical protein
LRFIFQLPAIRGVRVVLTNSAFQNGDAGQILALEELQ